MRTNLKTAASFIALVALTVSFNFNLQAATINGSDTSKMAKKKMDKMEKGKMKMDDKMGNDKMKSSDKMSSDKMKAGDKMGNDKMKKGKMKMAKDSSKMKM